MLLDSNTNEVRIHFIDPRPDVALAGVRALMGASSRHSRIRRPTTRASSLLRPGRHGCPNSFKMRPMDPCAKAYEVRRTD